MEAGDFLVVAAFMLGFGVISGRIQSTFITAPMVFVVFGWLVGPDALEWVDVEISDDLVRTIMELTLVLVLFTDASRIDVRLLKQRFRRPLRILAFALPLTMVLGTVVALPLFTGLSVWEAAVLAIVLAPTDAALGQAVVSSPKVPAAVRQTLNVESGLNDGLALPFLAVGLALAGAAGEVESAGFWVRFALEQVLVAVAVGVVIGWVGGRLVAFGTESGWMNGAFQRLSAVSVSLLSFALAVQFDGSGFIAAFVAGVVIGNSHRPICDCLFEFGEAEGQLLTLLTFLLFGAAAVGPTLDDLTWEVVLYAVLSLTVIRMLPVAVSLVGEGLQRFTVVFLAWFGPRGVASILFAIVVLDEVEFGARSTVFTVVSFTVLLSVFAHGLTARPAVDYYGTRFASMTEEMGAEEMEAMAELEPVPEMPVRIPHRK